MSVTNTFAELAQELLVSSELDLLAKSRTLPRALLISHGGCMCGVHCAVYSVYHTGGNLCSVNHTGGSMCSVHCIVYCTVTVCFTLVAAWEIRKCGALLRPPSASSSPMLVTYCHMISNLFKCSFCFRPFTLKRDCNMKCSPDRPILPSVPPSLLSLGTLFLLLSILLKSPFSLL